MSSSYARPADLRHLDLPPDNGVSASILHPQQSLLAPDTDASYPPSILPRSPLQSRATRIASGTPRTFADRFDQKIFDAIYSRALVYNTCWEDPAADRLALGIDSLTMIPEWSRAIDNALAMLRPGGLLGAVDFYVSSPNPPPGLMRHGVLTRCLWPLGFAHDGVRLTDEHLRRLRDRLPRHSLLEGRGAVPYLPGLRVPYDAFAGQKQWASDVSPRPVATI